MLIWTWALRSPPNMAMSASERAIRLIWGIVSGSFRCQGVSPCVFVSLCLCVFVSCPNNWEHAHRLHGLQVPSKPVIFRLRENRDQEIVDFFCVAIFVNICTQDKMSGLCLCVVGTFVYETRWVVNTSTVLPSHWIRAIPTCNMPRC